MSQRTISGRIQKHISLNTLCLLKLANQNKVPGQKYSWNGKYHCRRLIMISANVKPGKKSIFATVQGINEALGQT